MKKRLYSVVLLFSFLFCSGGLLVGHADSDNDNKEVLTTSFSFMPTTSGENLSFSLRFYSDSTYTDSWAFSHYGSGAGTETIFRPSSWASANGRSSRYISVTLTDRVNLLAGELYSLNCDFFLYGSSQYGFGYSPDSFRLFLNPALTPNVSDPVRVVSKSGSSFIFTVDRNVVFSSFVLIMPDDCKTYDGVSIGDKIPYGYVGQLSIQYLGDYSTGTNVSDAVNSQGQAIQDKIESQFDTSQGSEVGSAAQDFADQAAESLGVVSYVDTLFSGLSGLVTAGSTTLTFPAFAIAVQGTDYQVWQEHTFDLSQLDGWFAGLMAAVRLATSVVVVGAVIHYLQSVYKDVIG